jgi:plastocyanin
MRYLVQVGFVLSLALVVGIGWTMSASPVHADAQTVKFVDNDAPAVNQSIDAKQSQWGYGPTQIVVTKGDMVTFENPSEGKRPHTVTSLSLAGPNFENGMAAGAKFDSSPSRDTLVTPGNSWSLDTSTLDPGNYAYFCRIHPWMVGEITVLAQQ